MYGTIPEPSGNQGRQTRTAGSPSQSKASIVAKLLLSGSSLKDVITLDPGYSLQNLIKMRTFVSVSAQLFQSAQQAQWPSNLLYRGECSLTRRLVEWCNLNIGCRRPLHQKQLYLHGPTSMRKTTFLNIVKFFNNSYCIPTGEDFYDLYQDPEPTLCYIDEYEGKETKPLGWLKQFSQGTEMNLRQKGGQRLKRCNPALIILSNYSLEQVYKKALSVYPTCLDPIYKRFEVVEAVSPIDNQGLVEALVAALLATTPPPSAEILEKLRGLVSLPCFSNSLSASITALPDAVSPVGAVLTNSASSVEEMPFIADASGTPEQASLNPFPLMMQAAETPTVSAKEKQSKHDRFMELRRKKIREQSEDKISSIDKIAMKGNKRLFSGYNDDDDDLLQ